MLLSTLQSKSEASQPRHMHDINQTNITVRNMMMQIGLNIRLLLFHSTTRY